MKLFILPNNLKGIGVFILLLCIQSTYGQSDSLVFDNGIKILGEIKKMERGVLEMDVAYGDENFKIKWLSIKEIYTKSKFLVRVKNEILEGRIASIEEDKVKIYENETIYRVCSLNEIVFLSQFKDGFAERFSAALELGFNLTKAQDVRQFSFRSSIGYKTGNSQFNASYNMLRASQNNTTPVKRTDGLLNYSRVLFGKWYGIATINTLSNTEQKLDLRANAQLGLGNYLYSTNKAYWGVKTGINNNIEQFSNESSNRNTWEGFLGTDVNLYNVGDIDFNFVFMGYTGFTESGRFRADTNLDLKYDLPFDLFVRLGFSLNYDNRPAISASETDYILRTGIGWEW